MTNQRSILRCGDVAKWRNKHSYCRSM